MARGRKKRENVLTNLKGIPAKPTYLDDVAGKEWDRLVTLLAETGNLSVVDGSALALYCENYSVARQCREKLKTNGLCVGTPNGYEVQSPYFNMLKQAEKTMLSVLDKFGLNPRSRNTIKQTEKKDEAVNPWQDFKALEG